MTDIDLVYDVEIPEFIDPNQTESDGLGLTDEEIYDAILDQYVLPWEVEELPETEDVPADEGNGEETEQNNSVLVDSDF